MSNPVTRTRFGLTRRTVLTNAQVLALPTTGIELIPAQGNGLVILPVSAFVRLEWVADYANIDAVAVLTMGQVLQPLYETSTNAKVSFLLAPGATVISVHGMTGLMLPVASDVIYGNVGFVDADFDNVALSLAVNNAAAGNLTGGDPGNSLMVTVFYNVVKLG